MKKLSSLLLVVPAALACVSCGNKFKYPDLVRKMESFHSKVVVATFTSGNDYSETGFYTNENNVMAVYNITRFPHYDYYMEFELPYLKEAPQYYFSTYSCIKDEEPYDDGKFYLSNYVTISTMMHFYEYNDSEETSQATAEQIATSMVRTALYDFEAWIHSYLEKSIKKIGLFPAFFNYQ